VPSCQSCTAGNYLSGTSCAATCPDGTYADTASGQCLSCAGTCATCTGPASSQCASCPSGSLLYSGTCYGNGDCPVGTWPSSDSLCSACTSPCTACSDSASNCTACPVNEYLYEGTCFAGACPQGTYIYGSSCIDCNAPCQTCTGADTCSSCTAGTYLYGTSCLSTCPANDYVNSTTGQCAPCTPPCSSCSSASTSACSSCSQGYALYSPNSTCVTSCPDGYFTYTATDGSNTEQCLACSGSCTECSGTATTCTACPDGTILFSGTCYAACPAGTVDVAGVCQPCTDSCATCTNGSPSSCTSCASGTYLANGTCGVTCPAGSTPVGGSNCVPCTSPCATCDIGDPTTCLSCLNGGYLYGTTCVDTCPAGSSTSSSSTCVACQSPCATCTSSSSSCASCVAGYELYGNACYETCPAGTYVNGALCSACTDSCASCVGAGNTCTACNQGSYLWGTQCVAQCPSGSFLNATTGICVPCTAPCTACSASPSTCTACESNYYYYAQLNQCFGSCPAGSLTTTSPSNACITCSNNCATCSNTTSICTSCSATAANDLLDPSTGICEVTCPIGKVAQGSVCVPCVAPCATCSGSPTVCSTCTTGTLYLDGTCYSECPSGYVASGASCVPCTPPCATCNGTQSICSTCTEGNILDGSSCVQSCPAGTYQSGPVCDSCTSPCATCTGQATTCTTCDGGTFLYNGDCVATCPSTTYTNGTECSPCAFPCDTCFGYATVCLTCAPGEYFYESVCYTNCPYGTSVSANQCAPIPQQCPAVSQLNANFVQTLPDWPANGTCAEGFNGTATGYCLDDGSWDPNQFSINCTFFTNVNGGRIFDLAVSAADSSSVTLVWSTHNVSVPQFVVKISTDGVNFQALFGSIVKNPTLVVSGLQQDTLYYFQVFGANSRTSIDATGAQLNATTTIAPPGALVPGALAPNGFVVSWSPAVNSLAQYYRVSILLEGSTSTGTGTGSGSDSSQQHKRSSADNYTTETVLATVPASVTTFNITGLWPSTAYQVWVQAGLDGLAPEPVGSKAIISTAPLPPVNINNYAPPVQVIAPVVIVVLLVLIALIIALICYRRRVARRQKDILENFGSAVADSAGTLRNGNVIPDNVAIYKGRAIPEVMHTHTKVMGADATQVNTVLEVALPGFLKLNYAIDLRPDTRLTAGGAGTIWKASIMDQQVVSRSGGHSVVALKEVTDMPNHSAEENAEHFHQEVAIMWSMSFHPNIIKLIGYTDEPRTIITPLYKTDLFRFLHHQSDKSTLDSDLILHLCSGLMAAIDTVHSMGIAHRDIKSPNVLLAEPVSGIYPQPILCDFGLARTADDGTAVKSKAMVVHGFSPRYAPPEVFARMHMPGARSNVDDDKRSDMFSIGVTFWEILARRVPWEAASNDEVERTIRGGGRLPQPHYNEKDDVHVLVVEIVNACLHGSSIMRPTSGSVNNKLIDLTTLRSSGMAPQAPPSFPTSPRGSNQGGHRLPPPPPPAGPPSPGENFATPGNRSGSLRPIAGLQGLPPMPSTPPPGSSSSSSGTGLGRSNTRGASNAPPAFELTSFPNPRTPAAGSGSDLY